MLWTPVQQKVQQWMAMPKELRPKNLRTKKAVAEMLHITPALVYRWQNLSGWWDQVFKFARLQIGEDLPGILKAMVQQALGGDVRAAKLCLETLGVHADKLIIEGHMRHDNLLVILDGSAADGHGNANVTNLGSSIDVEADLIEAGEDPSEDVEIIVFEELLAGPPSSPSVVNQPSSPSPALPVVSALLSDLRLKV